jgi:hypothetical protein
MSNRHEFAVFVHNARVLGLCRCGTSRIGNVDIPFRTDGDCPGPTETTHPWTLASGNVDGVAAACPRCGTLRVGSVDAAFPLDLSGVCGAA